MTEHDIAEIETKLGIRAPAGYRQFMVSRAGRELAGMLSDVNEVIAVNERNRQMSWLDRPLDRVFFIFATDARGREIFMDLDFFEPVIMVADYQHKRAVVLSRTFHEWISKYDCV